MQCNAKTELKPIMVAHSLIHYYELMLCWVDRGRRHRVKFFAYDFSYVTGLVFVACWVTDIEMFRSKCIAVFWTQFLWIALSIDAGFVSQYNVSRLGSVYNEVLINATQSLRISFETRVLWRAQVWSTKKSSRFLERVTKESLSSCIFMYVQDER